ncbi:MAG TPA: T9SS type A sorting domain-containing protein [Acidobacteriota bacterium]|nr:T9SS type A sorting domain-containing protein [Acidobacteriota bacterium]
MQPVRLILSCIAVLLIGAPALVADDPISGEPYTVYASDQEPDDTGPDPVADYYWPWTNNPPGPPPNYNLVDSSYFQGVPVLPGPLETDLGGYYIYNDTAAGKWYIANFLYSRGQSLEQFHGSILVTMEQDPTPAVNLWAQGFELSCDLKQNDRWGWVRWPDSIAENLYEIWWDITIDYAKIKDTGDFRDTLGIVVAGCAIDFNLWSSGHTVAFNADQVYLGDDLTLLSSVPGFVDTYAGITDQYQLNDPIDDPNTSRFTPKSLPGATFNMNGLIVPGTTYGDRYTGSWAYEANGIQFSTVFCPPFMPPNFVTPGGTDTVVICSGEAVYDTIIATDPNPGDVLTMTLLSGPGFLSSTPSVSPVVGYYDFSPSTSGAYTAVFEVIDGTGGADTLQIIYEVTVGTAPVVVLPDDTAIFLCDPAEICLPLDVLDADCDVTSVTTNLGQYSGTLTNFDQVARLDHLGGTIIQIGGGAPGKVLYIASDFVPPVNSQSGVDVTLPDFGFVDFIVDYGSFPTGLEPGNSADHLAGPPTDMTFTAPGPGGPDGGDGDGSLAFAAGNFCTVGYSQAVTTCNGANTDFVVFTNTNGGGTAELQFRLNGVTVHTLTRVFPGGSAGSGIGGITFDLPDGLVFNEVKISCLAGPVEIDALAARTAPSPTTEDICFAADTSGVYEVIATATDACGYESTDMILVTVTLNSAPHAAAGPDQSLFVCDFEQICLPVSFHDADGNLVVSELLSGPGSLVDDQICFTPATSGAHTFVIRAVDACGLEDRDTVVVTIDRNDPPVAEPPSPVTVFLCDTVEVCYTFTATDPNGGPLVWSFLAGAGTISPDGEFCLTPTASGSYTATVIVADSCGAADTTSIIYYVTLNSAPVTVDPTSPMPRTLCTVEEICYQFQANDTDGDPLTWTKLTGDGTVSPAGLWCFTPDESGSYAVTLAVTDTCGAADTTGKTYEITVNDPPTVAFGNDTSVSLCAPEEICLVYTPSDPQGPAGLIEEMVSGYGSIDTAADRICFTPTAGGTYEFVVRVTDSCSAFDKDTIVVTVTLGQFASIDCPTEPIHVSLCEPDTVCQMLPITPASASVTVSNGIYANGELCIYSDTSGTYEVTVIAETSCGADTCVVTFVVEIGEAAQIACPDPQSIFICEAQSVCIPVGIMGPSPVVTVSPIGTYSAGHVCFPADTSGHYEIEVVASTGCGTDTCIVIADVQINRPPLAVDPPSPLDTFLCDPGQVCYQFGADDPDGGTLTWSRLTGDGTVGPSGQWCVTAGSTGSFSVTAEVADSCGAADTVSLTLDATVNTPPVFSLGNDTGVFLCLAEQICLPFSLYDAEGNVAAVELISGGGALFVGSDLLCFTPPVAGNYEFVARVTDSCGVAVYDTLLVAVDFNDPPVVFAGEDKTVFQCAPQAICWPTSVSDPDGNLQVVELITGPGTYDGTNICFTPTGTLDYEFVLKATDSCGTASFDTVVVHYTLNSPPVADAGADQALFLCSPDQICWPAGCSDVDGNLSDCALISGPGTYDSDNICFTPGASGAYQFVLEASDACGAVDRDTVVIDVTINSGPVCVMPSDTTIFQCAASEVCLPAYATDIDGNLELCQIVSGPGVLTGGDWCYTPVTSQSVTVTVRCLDSCGAECTSSFKVEFEINESPVVQFGPDFDTTLCLSSSICLPYTAYDPNDPRSRTLVLETGAGTLDTINSEICFTPGSSGTYTFVLAMEDECGRVARDTINVGVVVNTAPVADAGGDQDVFLCDDATTLCWPASCSDADGNLTDCIFSSSTPATYDGSRICFNPTQSGTYLFALEAVDDCGESSVDTAVIDVTINSAPMVTLDSDTSLEMCQPEPVCVGYQVFDPDGLSGIVESMLSGYGTIDTVANTVCFTPSAAGSYEFIVRATDSCGAAGLDTIVVTIAIGARAQIDCPASPIEVSLCTPDDVCQMLDVTPSTANVTVSYGSWANGELCFFADTSGTYPVTVIAADTCGADTCELVFNVSIGQAAQIDCPDPIDRFLCTPDTVCVPVGVVGTGAVVTITPIGTYTGGNVCFPADTSGHYELQIVAATDCGTDTCLLIADITINSPPVATNPPSVDTFLCAAGQICAQFAATDADGDLYEWRRLSGNGTVTPGGLWCFDAPTSGSYSVTAEILDSCNAADTLVAVINVTLNGKPVVSLPEDTAVYLCAAQEVCFLYTVLDGDDNVTVEELVESPPGSVLDTLANQFCFTPTVAGTYSFVLRATDACGAAGADTLVVTVGFNRPPVASLAPDTGLYLCNPAQVCRAAACSDEDANLDSCYLTTGEGTYDGSTVCFTPDTSGTYTFILRAVDDCGAADEDTSRVTVTLNSDPTCQVPQGVTQFFQCSPSQVSLPVSATDPDGNYDHCELISGPGSIVGGNWSYTPSTDETVWVVVMCVDSCGAHCIDSFQVSFSINAAPLVVLPEPQTILACDDTTICISVDASDQDGNLASVELMSSTGSYNDQTGQICFGAGYGTGDDKSYTFIIKATDSCGAEDYDTTTITVDFNAPPVVSLPPDFTAYLESVGELCFTADISDNDGNLADVTVVPDIAHYDDLTGQICFDADTTGVYCFQVTATDGCSGETDPLHCTDVDTICVTVEVDQCVHVQIEKSHNVVQGQFTDLRIFLNGSGHELGGFNFLVWYDVTALNPALALPGDLLDMCGWEYFTYRFGADGNCESCPTGLLRLVAIAETNNGAYHPGCFLDGMTGTLATIRFLVSNDRTLEGQFAPVSFFWTECGDNAFSSREGDTLWISRNVYTFDLNAITDISYGFPGYFGAPDLCLLGQGPDKPKPARCVDFTNGGVDIVPSDSIDMRGDINLNGLAYEIADAVMFTNYFTRGPDAFGTGRRVDAAIAASDVNGDGIPLTVADLVYLIRVVVGDAQQMPKINPNADLQAEFSVTGNVLCIEQSDAPIGAIYVVLSGKVTPRLHENASFMEMQYRHDDSETRVLIYNEKGETVLGAGPVLELDGRTWIRTIQVGSFDGQVVKAKVKDVPDRFSLSQNYPNPFNPMTVLEYALPVASDWHLVVYNILGQQVENWSGRDEAGYYQIEWDAGRYASGVYFYRLTAGGFSATRKMVLLK